MADRKEATETKDDTSTERREFLAGAAGAGLGLTMIGPLIGLSADEAHAQGPKILKAAGGLHTKGIAYGGPLTAGLNKFFTYERMYNPDGTPNLLSGPIYEYRKKFTPPNPPYVFGAWAPAIVKKGEWGSAPKIPDLHDTWNASVAEMPDIAKKKFAEAIRENFDPPAARPKPILVVVQSSGISSADDATEWKGHRLVRADVADSGGRPYLLLAMLCPTDAVVPMAAKKK